jgi:hypothetical protein
MSSERASIFGQGPELDVSGFTPRNIPEPAAQADQVKAISETADFVSREPATRKPVTASVARVAQSEPMTREPRRHRTGRNIQLNIKARADTIERFYAIGFWAKPSSARSRRLSAVVRTEFRRIEIVAFTSEWRPD